MYVKKEIAVNDKIEIEKYYDGRYGAPGMPREKKKKVTPAEMARQNFWQRYQHLRRLMEINFAGGDLHVTLTCRIEDRPTKEEAPEVIRQFRDKMVRDYKKQGWECKYIITCEIGSRGAVHWHMILNNKKSNKDCTWDIIRRHWKKGRPNMVPLDENREYGELARYIVKETAKRMENEQTIEKLSYIISRNLEKPVEKKSKKDAKKWTNPPRPPKGYEIVKDSVVNGINKFTGYPYQKYVVRILQKGGGRSGGD